jgi:hypothetical protein
LKTVYLPVRKNVENNLRARRRIPICSSRFADLHNFAKDAES